MAKELTHLNARGDAHMVDVGEKPATRRRAVAEGFVRMKASTRRVLESGSKKGDALAVARIAGVQGAKRTADLIPLCHPIALSHVTVELKPQRGGVKVTATCETVGPTGVEMEALSAVSAACLTLYDMLKAVERGIEIDSIRLLKKSGGRSGSWSRQPR
ncbi:MAG: cyclic pyranopterin monophosphate synthase MoaC [Myxococcota bacterium]